MAYPIQQKIMVEEGEKPKAIFLEKAHSTDYARYSLPLYNQH